MILIIDHFDSFSYNLYQLIAGLGYETQVHRCDEIGLEDIQALEPEAIILSPGPRRPEETGITLSLLESSFSQTRPVIGICLGFQSLGLIWNVPVNLANEVVHGKTIELKTSNHPIFKSCPNPIQVARYHSLCLASHDIKEQAHILSEYENMVMIAEDIKRPWLGMQFHPESFLTPDGKQIMSNAIEYLKQK